MRFVPEASNTKKGKLTFGIKLSWIEEFLVSLDVVVITGNGDNDVFDASISLLLEVLLSL